ncbi:uncharacterized protein LOC142353930 [Convolutriloba macropyga]|uniref:uncharacterized protein LOC142353930 n=1 Tax=Convolutriloba macropyga TaxID=536237 RepID=UPI003F51EC9E
MNDCDFLVNSDVLHNDDSDNKLEGSFGNTAKPVLPFLKVLEQNNNSAFYYDNCSPGTPHDECFFEPGTLEPTATKSETDPEIWLAANKKIVRNALLASEAIYHNEDPWSYLNERRHSFGCLDVHENKNCHFLIAEDTNANVYLAFRGSVTGYDWEKNFAFDLEKLNIGSLHSGFLEKTRTIPLSTILSSKDLKGKQFIICGHSQGGAVAAIVYTLLKEAKSSSETSFLEGIRGLKNITFAAPLFGDEELKSIIEDEKLRFDSDMFHYVAQNDPVPGSLVFAHIARQGVRHYLKRSRWRLMIRPPLHFLRLAFRPFNNFMAENVDRSDGSFMVSNKSYQPIGNYIFLSPEEDSAKFVDCRQRDEKLEWLTKTSLTKSNSKSHVSSRKTAHKLDNYKLLLSEDFLQVSNVFQKTTIFKPKICNVAIDNDFDGCKKNCKVTISGENITADCILECKILLTTKEKETSVVKIFDHQNSETVELNNEPSGISLDAKIEHENIVDKNIQRIVYIKTIFGKAEFDLSKSKAEKSVSACIQMAFDRCSALETKNLSNELTKSVREMLRASDVKELKCDQKSQNIGQFVGQVIQAFKNPLLLEASNPTKNFLEGAISSVGLLNFDWQCQSFEAGTLTIGRKHDASARQNGNYSTVLRYISNQVKQAFAKQLREDENPASKDTDSEMENAVYQIFAERLKTKFLEYFLQTLAGIVSLLLVNRCCYAR